jgi:hypothetical protein
MGIGEKSRIWPDGHGLFRIVKVNFGEFPFPALG